MAWLGTWSNRIKLTVDSSKVDTANLTDFPAMVYISAASGIGDVDASAVFDELASDANRKKIAVTSDDGTSQLYVEIERWDDANEKAWLHVKIPVIAYDADTDIYLYYDVSQPDNDSYVGDTGDAVAQNVWNNTFKAVYHLAQDPNGDISGAITDSTSNGNDGTPYGSMTTADLVDGQVGKGIEFDGSNDYIDCGSPNNFTGSVDFSISFCFNSADTGGILGTDIASGISIALYESPAGELFFKIDDGPHVVYVLSAGTYNDGNWHYSVLVWNAAIGQLEGFVDGASFGSSINVNIGDLTDTLMLGGYRLGASKYFTSEKLDDVKINNVALSDGWIKADYNNLWDSFITFGSSEANPDVYVSADCQSLTIATLSATIQSNVLVLAECKELTITPYDANVHLGVPNTNATTATFTITPNQASIAYGTNVDVDAVSLTFSTHSASIITLPGLEVSESVELWETLTLEFGKSVTSTANLSDAVDIQVGIPVNEWLNLRDVVTNNWFGSEDVTSTLMMFGRAIIVSVFTESVTSAMDMTDAVTKLHRMISSVSSSMVATDAVDPSITFMPYITETMTLTELVSYLRDLNRLADADVESSMVAVEAVSAQITFNPSIVEAIAISAAISVIRTMNPNISESVQAADSAGFSWLESISESMAMADAVNLSLAIMLLLTESLGATDAALANLNINESVDESILATAVSVIQQFITENILDTLHMGITVRLDGELWECWVLNTNKFHISVYSGFEFNSYAVYNGTAYACGSDGIYRLDGDDDNGTDISAGIVLPTTDFGTSRQKRFRKAYFGISGSLPSIRVETDTADVTYTITDSRANLQRNQKGKEWTLKIADFTDIDFIELIPIILTRR